jgi:hypothetical protein
MSRHSLAVSLLSGGRGSGLSQARTGSVDGVREESVGRELERCVCVARDMPLRGEHLGRHVREPMALRHLAADLTTDDAEGIGCLVECASYRIVFAKAKGVVSVEVV